MTSDDRQLLGDFLGGVGPDFRKRRVVVRDGGEVLDRGAVAHGDDDFVDQFRSFGADDRGSEDFASVAAGEEFYQTLGFAHQE